MNTDNLLDIVNCITLAFFLPLGIYLLYIGEALISLIALLAAHISLIHLRVSTVRKMVIRQEIEGVVNAQNLKEI